jgi:hypothetical protein
MGCANRKKVVAPPPPPTNRGLKKRRGLGVVKTALNYQYLVPCVCISADGSWRVLGFAMKLYVCESKHYNC